MTFNKIILYGLTFGCLCFVNYFIIVSLPLKLIDGQYKGTTSIYHPSFGQDNNLLPIYVITPINTHSLYSRAHLTRLSQTLSLVPNIRWIVVEDNDEPSVKISRILREFPHPHLHLWYHKQYNTSDHFKGCAQRNLALAWLRLHMLRFEKNASYIPEDTFDRSDNNTFYLMHAQTFPSTFTLMYEGMIPNDTAINDIATIPGIIYFADDDNTYDLELFREMRSIKYLGVWPVAFCGGLLVERPLVIEGKVVDWLVQYLKKSRPMPIDMAGFAVHTDVLLKQKQDVYFYEYINPDGLESGFVKRLANLTDLEPLASNCTKILVWHTKTAMANTELEEEFSKNYQRNSSDGLDI